MPRAKRGDKVRIHYTCILADGTVFDSSRGKDPLELTIGANEIIIGVDQAIEEMSVGERKSIVVAPEDAYGPRHEKLVVDVPLSEMSPGVKPRLNQRLRFSGPGREPLSVVITAITDTTITMDGNHPLAGKQLTFDLEIVDILSSQE